MIIEQKLLPNVFGYNSIVICKKNSIIMDKKNTVFAVAKMLLLLFMTNSVYTSCKKDTNVHTFKVVEYVKNDSLKQNVSIIKSDDAILTSDSIKLSQGIYVFQFIEAPINYKVGDVIVSQDNNGFLRKVTNSTISGNNVTLQTQQATLEDLYKDATINFQMNLSKQKSSNILNAVLQETKINYIASGVSLKSDGLSYDFSNTTIYQQGPLTFKITDGNVTYNPNYFFSIKISSSTVNKIAFYAENSDLNINCDINLNATQNVQLVNYTKTLADVDKISLIWVSAVPVIVVLNTKLNAKLTTDITAGLDINTGFTNNYKITFGAIYENKSWVSKYNLTPTFIAKPVAMSGIVQFTQNLTITPDVSVKLYGVTGPYFIPEMYEQFDAQIASPSLDWDALLKVGLNAKVGANITIFGKTLADYSKTYNVDEELWKAPFQIAKISGDNQTGTANTTLLQPIKLKVTDNLNNPIKNVVVYFDVTQGGGSVNHSSSITNADGSAETIWTIGTGSTQKLIAKVKKADGTEISGSPLTFTANESISNHIAYYRYDDDRAYGYMNLSLSFNNGVISGVASSLFMENKPYPLTGTLSGSNMILNINMDNGYDPSIIYPDGNHYINYKQIWVITGIVNEDHYNATFQLTQTSAVWNGQGVTSGTNSYTGTFVY